ncbi:hypothetical protein B296_00037420, partial [Ensete ventricosum]
MAVFPSRGMVVASLPPKTTNMSALLLQIIKQLLSMRKKKKSTDETERHWIYCGAHALDPTPPPPPETKWGSSGQHQCPPLVWLNPSRPWVPAPTTAPPSRTDSLYCWALLPYLHRPASARRGLTTVAVVPGMCRRCYSSRHYWVEGNDDEGRKESVVVVMGATGTGKSKLSIELATRFSGEVVNSDKIQVYRGLDVTTNKMPVVERCGVPHHLLGEVDPAAGEVSPAAFREMAARAIAGITGRGLLPVVAGGSNSMVHAAMAVSYDPERSPFAADWRWRRKRREGALRYRCCFLWVDVEAAALAEQLDRRVEEMVGAGMVEELDRYFAEEAKSDAVKLRHPGLAKAIGVAEFREYFRGEGRG